MAVGTANSAELGDTEGQRGLALAHPGSLDTECEADLSVTLCRVGRVAAWLSRRKPGHYIQTPLAHLRREG